ncbi:hypothetical protein DUI87_03809 [Hirundo rustica rustica]|uniref:Uncharacterized protein n=1 Tax=Hirundo rustica rustica TaxID=333673 RepID=A0A3M0L5K8_HIRRU|nr:hypothetical protein DUI87_03809 [Hirundo rustica rustica]
MTDSNSIQLELMKGSHLVSDSLPSSAKPVKFKILMELESINPYIIFSGGWSYLGGVVLTHVQHLALGLVKSHEIPMGPVLQLVRVPPDDLLFFRSVNSSTQLGVISKFAESARNPLVYVNDEVFKLYWSQYGLPLSPVSIEILSH